MLLLVLQVEKKPPLEQMFKEGMKINSIYSCIICKNFQNTSHFLPHIHPHDQRKKIGSLAKTLQELSSEFRQKQRKYLKDVQAQKNGGVFNNAEMENKFGIDFNDDINHDHVGLSSAQIAVVDDLQAAVQSRDSEIANIAQSIEELGSIFKELAVLVM